MRKDIAMTLQDKFSAALAILAEHNTAIGGVDKPGYVNPDAFFEALKMMGATTEDRLKRLQYEEILECFPTSGPVKPKLIAKDIAKVFRGNTEVGDSAPKSAQGEVRPVSAKKANYLSPRELLYFFDPEEPTNPVGTRLNQISKGDSFIVYESGITLDVDSSLQLLNEIKQGFKGRKDFLVNGIVKPVFKVGELPDNFVDENPLYVGRPLRPDGTCDQTNRSWEGVSSEVRQIIRLITEGKNVSFDDAHKFLDFAHGLDPMSTLRNRYRDASLKFDSLASTGGLPTLKILLGKEEEGQENSPRPFGQGKQVVWQKVPAYISHHNWQYGNYQANKQWKNNK